MRSSSTQLAWLDYREWFHFIRHFSFTQVTWFTNLTVTLSCTCVLGTVSYLFHELWKNLISDIPFDKLLLNYQNKEMKYRLKQIRKRPNQKFLLWKFGWNGSRVPHIYDFVTNLQYSVNVVGVIYHDSSFDVNDILYSMQIVIACLLGIA